MKKKYDFVDCIDGNKLKNLKCPNCGKEQFVQCIQEPLTYRCTYCLQVYHPDEIIIFNNYILNRSELAYNTNNNSDEMKLKNIFIEFYKYIIMGICVLASVGIFFGPLIAGILLCIVKNNNIYLWLITLLLITIPLGIWMANLTFNNLDYILFERKKRKI